MNNAIKRSILRWIHLICCIPTLGYIYGEASEVQPYAAAVWFGFIPVIILSGFWMYSGVFFAIIGVALWLGAYRVSGFGGGSPESDRAIHWTEDPVGDSRSTIEVRPEEE